MSRIYFILFFVFLSGFSFAQLISIQDFETTPATPTMTYTVTGGTTYTGSSGTGDRPASSPFFVSSNTAYGAQNTTSTLTFMNHTSLGTCTGKYFTFRLAAWSISSTGNGMESGDYVRVEISLDGGSTWSNELEVRGPTCGGCANANWDYTGTGTAAVTYDGNNTPTVFNASGSGTRADGHSTVTVNVPDASTQARIRITMLNNSSGERWTIDNVAFYGTCVACSPAAEPTTHASSLNTSSLACTSATLTWTRGNGTNVLVVMSTACSPTSPITDPVDQTSYTASTVYGSGSTTGTDDYVVYNGSGTSVGVTGLTAGTFYCFKVYEYNGTLANCTENYFTSAEPSYSFTTLTGCTGGAPTCVKLNEFVVTPDQGPNGDPSTTGEFIELFNTCDCDVDLSCFVICMTDISGGARRGDCITIPSGTTLAAGAVFLFGGYGTNCTGGETNCDWPGLSLDLNWHQNYNYGWSVTGNAFYTTNVNNYIGVLNDGGEDISLFDGSGNFIDGVFYEGGAGIGSNNTENIGAVGGCTAKSIIIPPTSSHTDVGNEPGGWSDSGVRRNCDASWTWVQTVDQTPGAPLVCSNVSCILPMELLEFTASENEKNNVDIYWSTASETNSDYFEIERSADGENFTTIGIKRAAGNSSSLLNYYFEDLQPLKELTYYHLKLFDIDGSVSNSEIIALKNIQGNFILYPNPASSEIILEGEDIEFSEIRIYDASGRLVLSVNSNSVKQTIPLNNLSPGFYHVSVLNGNFFYNTTFILVK